MYVRPIVKKLTSQALCLGMILLLIGVTRAGLPVNRSTAGIVEHDQGPAVGARVRFKATPQSTLTDAKGQFQLEGKGERITAWLEGYFIAGQAFKQGTGVNPIQLKPLPKEDHEGYAWVDPRPDAARDGACANCHPQIFKEWSQSAHARGPLHKHFQSFYAGTKQDGQPNHGWHLLKEHPEGAGVCAACHAPTVAFQDEAFADLRRTRGVSALGVHCDYCHKIADTSLEHLGREHGRFAHRLLRPQDGQLFFGPLDDVDRGEDTYAPLYRESRYCASCHEGTVLGTKVYTTYSEWLVSPARLQGRSCQSCHMKPSGTMTNFAPGRGGWERDPQTLATHGTPGGDLATLQSCLTVDVNIQRNDHKVHVTTTTLARQVGHRVPTGYVDRHVLLVVEGIDANGQPVSLLSGPRLPPAAGVGPGTAGAYAGQAGWFMGRILYGTDGQGPVPFWRMEKPSEDTRLFPDKPDHRTWTYPSEVQHVRVRLIYRRFFHSQIVAKQLTDVESVVIVRKAAVPDH